MNYYNIVKRPLDDSEPILYQMGLWLLANKFKKKKTE